MLLQIAPHLSIDSQLKDILKATPGACLKYAIIEGNQLFTDLYPHLLNVNIAVCDSKPLGSLYFPPGTVQPVGEPLMSHFQKETAGVLQKFTLSEHRLVWSNLTRTW